LPILRPAWAIEHPGYDCQQEKHDDSCIPYNALMNCSSCGAPVAAGLHFCGMCGAPLQQSVRRERRKVSVVFIDLAGFTSLTQGFDPEELRDLADEVLTVVAGIIEDYDGHVDAFRGDGLIALFGAPRSHPDDTERAVLAAAAGLRAIERIGRAKRRALQGRAGVATGVVIAGALGSGRVREYTVMGSTVNLAARLESAATPGEVWVSPETYEETRHHLAFHAAPPVDLVGFPDIQKLYILASEQEQAQLDPYRHLEFVGCQLELAQLRDAHTWVVDHGSARELWLVGGAGLGKTRLLSEFTDSFVRAGKPALQDPLILWLEGRASEEHSWLPLARRIFDLAEGEDRRIWHKKIMSQLAVLLPGESRWHQQILISLGLARERSWTRLERRNSNRVCLAWRDLFIALTRQGEGRSLILAVDNTPQDPLLLEFLRLLRNVQAPLLVIRTSRQAAPSEESESALTVTVKPLNVTESLKLLNQVASPVMRVAIESLVYQVGGVPAYILELGRALTVSHAGSFSGSLAALLQARLDMLEAGERQLLFYAALTGERCWEPQLVSLLESSGGAQLERMQHENLLVKVADSSIPGMVEFRFQSELLRHAVLQMIPFADRPLLHLRIGTWLEQFAPLALSKLIGDHFRAGGSHDTAYSHYLAAAELALANGEGEAYRLFDLIATLDLPAELQLQGGLAYAQAALDLADWPKASALLQEIEAWSTAAPDLEASEHLHLLQKLRGELATLHASGQEN
jgi:class 3 adenylate cyclase